MNTIEVNNLAKKFGSFTAVDNVSFNVKQGEIFGFLGANGAGKSTTIRMLIGILEPTSGDAIVGGYSIKKEPDKVKTQIGYMSQKFSLYNDLTVEENIRFFAGVYGLTGKRYDERKKWVLKVANLEGKEKLLTASLPGGIKQRLALGTAVIHEPKIIFLDEPTSGVDPVSRRNFWDLIHELSASGTTVLVTTHYLDEAEFCNDIILINSGKLIAQGNAKTLKTNYIKNTILEIESDRIVESMEILEKEDWVGETSIFGNYIHIILNDNLKSDKDIIEVLTNRNSINVYRISKIVPTLEDVFIHLLEKDKSDV
ncbi:MAG TPA: ABC transporter ATP-binding protein [Ignavibacteriaceae bacterium]|jgi:ABC-2 type transport system ATP-binding protein|nr:MAG: putative ABC transporter ATP-binding protein YbhF [Ignavibacteria bacterium ADurb.Bin266]OQY74948.1 MAG: multidrug ABC transporter ATP-binding protein [Ignavibacteriales bacterium UTCHB2]HQF41439.1 ABC transporter ATP-binding protein [Ignavibacteriaceae bacterium]HQI39510.1 ABC transporter ATP-binding protein [Ignavibacteriaceae bacterium]